MTARDCVDAMEGGIRNAIPVAVACSAVGIIVGVATLTGIALEAADTVVALGSQIPSPLIQLMVTLLLTLLAVAAEGYLWTKVSMALRLLSLVIALMLIFPGI